MQKRQVQEITVGILAVLSIILVAIESLMTLSSGALLTVYILDGIICLVFAWDFILRLRRSEDRKRFMKTNGFEIFAMLPAILFALVGTIPAISSGLRALRLIRVVRVIILIARTRRGMERMGSFITKSNLMILAASTISIIFLGAFAVMILESETPNAQIHSFSDAVWWSITTVTTVGYGDIVPQSIPGRIMGMVLMVVGIGVMAAFISQISATLVERRMKVPEKTSSLHDDLAEQIKSRIDTIQEMDEKDMALLIEMIETLRRNERKEL